MKSEEGYRNSKIMACHCLDLGNASDWLNEHIIPRYDQSDALPVVGSDTSSVMRARSSDDISRGNQ